MTAMGNMRVTAGMIVCIVVAVASEVKVPDQRFQGGEGNDLKVVDTLNEVLVNVPNEKDVMYDYANKLVVYRFMDKYSQEPGPCYARPLEDGEKFIPRGKVSQNEKEIGKLRGTNEKVPKYMISKLADKMCRNTDIFRLEEYEENRITKMAKVCIRWKRERVCRRHGGWWSVTVTITCDYVEICVEFEDFFTKMAT